MLLSAPDQQQKKEGSHEDPNPHTALLKKVESTHRRGGRPFQRTLAAMVRYACIVWCLLTTMVIEKSAVIGVGVRRGGNVLGNKLRSNQAQEYNVMPNVKLVNHVETLGAPASSYAAIRKRVQGEDGLPKTYPPQQPFQPLQPGQSVRGDDSFPLASPVSIEPYPFKAKPFPIPHMGGISDEEGLKVYDNSAPNWNEKAREELGLTKKAGT